MVFRIRLRKRVPTREVFWGGGKVVLFANVDMLRFFVSDYINRFEEESEAEYFLLTVW